MDQTTARRTARQLGGIAVQARPGARGWILGGWPNQKGAVWIVVSLDRTEVLADTT